MKLHELLEAKTRYAQDKKTIKRLQDAGMMKKPGHMHRKGEDWESTKVLKPKKIKKTI